jgi:hypothetical protein
MTKVIALAEECRHPKRDRLKEMATRNVDPAHYKTMPDEDIDKCGPTRLSREDVEALYAEKVTVSVLY